MVVLIVGITTIRALLVPTLVVDVANVGNFYQGLLGCNVLYGHSKVLGLAAFALP